MSVNDLENNNFNLIIKLFEESSKLHELINEVNIELNNTNINSMEYENGQFKIAVIKSLIDVIVLKISLISQ